MNNEPQVDDLLSAFENPDMVEMPQEAPAPMAPEMSAPAPAPMAPEMAAPAPEPAPVAPEMSAPAPAPVAPEMAAPASEPAPMAPEMAAPAPSPEGNVDSSMEQPTAPAENATPTENAAQPEASSEEPGFVKKNIIFIGILFGLILLFIIFLPKIMELFGGVI